jgi:hypothetical protein
METAITPHNVKRHATDVSSGTGIADITAFLTGA